MGLNIIHKSKNRKKFTSVQNVFDISLYFITFLIDVILCKFNIVFQLRRLSYGVSSC